MGMTAEEKLMYDVMKAIYDSGIPISFKGSMVLKACLHEAGYTEDTRHTVDIDGNWNTDTFPTADQMVESLQKAVHKSGIDLRVSLYRMYGEGRPAGFELTEPTTEEVLFTMDVDVNRLTVSTKIYEMEGIRFRGVSPTQMIADKVSAISTPKVFRRIKDVVDIHYISRVFVFHTAEVLQTLRDCGRTLDSFDRFLNKSDELKHSYEKFRFAGGVNKPPFEEVYEDVKAFIKDVLPKE